MGKLNEAVTELGLNFASVKPGQGSEPLPSGWTHFRVERWEETATGEASKNPGTLMYKVALSVVGGDNANQWAFDQFVIDDGRMVSLNIGRMKALIVSCGIDEEIVNSEEFDPDTEWGGEHLIGQEVDGDVAYRKESGGYPAGNNIRGYRPHEYTMDDLVS